MKDNPKMHTGQIIESARHAYVHGWQAALAWLRRYDTKTLEDQSPDAVIATVTTEMQTICNACW